MRVWEVPSDAVRYTNDFAVHYYLKKYGCKKWYTVIWVRENVPGEQVAVWAAYDKSQPSGEVERLA